MNEMNTRCDNCKGKGAIQRDGKHVGNKQPYTLHCPDCNGVGHHRMPRDFELAMSED